MVDSYSIFTYICSERQDARGGEDTCCLNRRRSSGIGQLLNMIIFNCPELWQLPHVATRGLTRGPAAVARGAVRHRNVGSVPPLLAFGVYKLKLPPPHFQLDPGASNKMGSGDLKLFA